MSGGGAIDWLVGGLALLLGAGLGVFHFLSLRRVSADYLAGHGRRAIGLQVARLVAVAGVFYLLARVGAIPLLAAALGFVIARGVVMRRTEPTP